MTRSRRYGAGIRASTPVRALLVGVTAVTLSCGLLGCGTATQGSAAPAVTTVDPGGTHPTTDAPTTDAPTTTGPTTSAPPRTTPTTACDEMSVISSWTVGRRAAQLVVANVEESDVAAARPLVAQGVGGLILFGATAPSDLGHGLADLRADALDHLAPIVMTDEEGGGVQRMANLVGSLPWPRTMAATMTVTAVRALAQRVGTAMRAAGVTMDLAPVLDLSDGPGPDARHPDGRRSFSVQAGVAGRYGIAFAQGLLSAGVTPVVKHFPGLGGASYDTDFGPATDPPLSRLETDALLPFEAAISARLPVIMVSHVVVPGLTDGLPASLSAAAVTGLLRRRLHFGGLIVTDSLEADAVSAAGYGVSAAAVKAVEAGDDMVLLDSDHPEVTTTQVVRALETAVAAGHISVVQLDDAVEHVLTAKGVSLCRRGSAR